MTNKIIYISGPMTGLSENNFPAFRHAAERLREAGYTVVSPHEIETPEKTWESYMRADLKALMDCNTVATLPGWQYSRGACIEVNIAHELGMTVISLKTALEERTAVGT